METKIIEEKKDYKPLGVSGLGGWLILVQIGLYGTIVIQIMQFFQNTSMMFDTEVWTALTSNESEFYHPLWGATVVFEIVFTLAILIFSVYILINFYGKKSILPRLLIIFYVLVPLVGIIDYILLIQIPLVRELETGKSLRNIIRPVMTSAIWIAYFIKSERVKNTFIK
ncbi:DUF2569 domain-containing protein [Paenibacillus nitricinens]|uniref:DUF2569 domain-containing protein n=1 Tax=Paenibacillus nitricinens TaxID=3367691 RepID=UPI003F851A01